MSPITGGDSISPPAISPPAKMPDKSHDQSTTDQEEDNDHNSISAPISSKLSRDKALIDFRFKLEESIFRNHLLAKKKNNSKIFSIENVLKQNPTKEIKLWGVPLLPSKNHEGTDVILMKFLKAKHYKANEAFTLLRKTLKWRARFRPDEEIEMDNAWFWDGRDKEGRLLCYSVLGREMVSMKSRDYFRWRVNCVEKEIGNLDFRQGEEGGVDMVLQIIDLKNAPGFAMKEVNLVSNKMITLLHDYYPGIVYKNLIINVPPWFMAVHALNLRLITQRSKNKFVFVKPSRVTQTLLKYATIENILVRYGGLKRENDTEFSTEDEVFKVKIRANTTVDIQIPINETEVTVTWDVSVVGYEVMYKEEFIPEDDCSYNILLQEKKMGGSIRNSFHIREPGKIIITIVNGSFTKKKAFYRYKIRPSVPMYMSIK